MKERWKFRLYILFFSAAVFSLTAVGLAFQYYKTLVWTWLPFPYMVAWVVVLILAADFFVDQGKLSVKRLLLLTLSVMIMSGAVSHSIWLIVTPKWSFSVTTDKSTYSLGETVNIRVSLRNMGLITHSFKSLVSDPVLVFITRRRSPYDYPGESVWWNYPWEENITEFSILPNQSLERNLVWNQTNIWSQLDPKNNFWNQTHMSGTYIIEVFIPDGQADVISDSYALFSAGMLVNVTAS